MSKLTRRMLGLKSAPDAPLSGHVEPFKPVPAGFKALNATPNPRFVGLQDAGMGGFYQVSTGELYTGIPVSADDVVVDVGCGEGAALGFCADRGAHVIAVDVHAETLDTAREFLAGKPAGSMEFHLGPAERLPLSEGIASRVLCMEVLEHVDDPHAVLAEMARIARPGALFLITVPDQRGEELTKIVGPEHYFQPPNHIRIIGREELAEWVRVAGLEVVSHTFNGFFWVLWFALFWNREVDIDDPTEDPVLKHWTLAWKALMDSPNGAKAKRQFDEFMPKSQIIVARKSR